MIIINFFVFNSLQVFKRYNKLFYKKNKIKKKVKSHQATFSYQMIQKKTNAVLKKN